MIILKILIVDDEAGMRRGAERALKSFHITSKDIEDEISFEVTTAEDGKNAYSLIENNNYDIIILDYKLPDTSGLEILAYINNKSSSVVSIMMTAYASIEVAISATKQGAFDFLAKPFTPDELRNVIKKAATGIVFKRKAQMLEEQKKQIRFEFLSILSHELKAPLNAIESFLKIAQDGVLGNDIASYEHIIKRSLSRIDGMRKLIFDLLDLTRIESGLKKRELKVIDIVSCLRESVETYQQSAALKGIKILINSPEKAELIGDYSELIIMFNNLISNAVKYNLENGSIYITLNEAPSLIDISIKDTGIGIKPNELTKLFGEFVRIKNEKTAGIEGSGLGLSILKKLASLYDGVIKVESTYGSGTEFKISLKKIR